MDIMTEFYNTYGHWSLSFADKGTTNFLEFDRPEVLFLTRTYVCPGYFTDITRRSIPNIVRGWDLTGTTSQN